MIPVNKTATSLVLAGMIAYEQATHGGEPHVNGDPEVPRPQEVFTRNLKAVTSGGIGALAGQASLGFSASGTLVDGSSRAY